LTPTWNMQALQKSIIFSNAAPLGHLMGLRLA
jgi:hypothetical protein